MSNYPTGENGQKLLKDLFSEGLTRRKLGKYFERDLEGAKGALQFRNELAAYVEEEEARKAVEGAEGFGPYVKVLQKEAGRLKEDAGMLREEAARMCEEADRIEALYSETAADQDSEKFKKAMDDAFSSRKKGKGYKGGRKKPRKSIGGGRRWYTRQELIKGGATLYKLNKIEDVETRRVTGHRGGKPALEYRLSNKEYESLTGKASGKAGKKPAGAPRKGKGKGYSVRDFGENFVLSPTVVGRMISSGLIKTDKEGMVTPESVKKYRAFSKEYAFLSDEAESLAESAGIARMSIRNRLDELKKKGIVENVGTKGKGSVYVFRKNRETRSALLDVLKPRRATAGTKKKSKTKVKTSVKAGARKRPARGAGSGGSEEGFTALKALSKELGATEKDMTKFAVGMGMKITDRDGVPYMNNDDANFAREIYKDWTAN